MKTYPDGLFASEDEEYAEFRKWWEVTPADVFPAKIRKILWQNWLMKMERYRKCIHISYP